MRPRARRRSTNTTRWATCSALSISQHGVHPQFHAQERSGRTTVTLVGTGYSATASQNTVTFNGTAATVTSATTTQLVVTVPTGATTGPIAVTTPNGSATSSTPFTVTAAGAFGAPTIASFTPT